MKYGILIGVNAKSFNPGYITRKDWEEPVKELGPPLDPDNRGQMTEHFIKILLSWFNGEIIQTCPGSKLDLLGIDFLLNQNGKTFAIQVKTSAKGVDHFLKGGSMGDKSIVLWVDTRTPETRRAFTFLFIKKMKELGIYLKPSSFKVLKRFNLLKKYQIRLHKSNISASFGGIEQWNLVRLGILPNLNENEDYYIFN